MHTPNQIACNVESIGDEDERVVGEANDELRHEEAEGDKNNTVKPPFLSEPLNLELRRSAARGARMIGILM